MNIVMLSNYDFSGSGWHISQAVKKYTSHNSIIIKKYKHERDYHTDYLLTKGKHEELQSFLNKADIVHFKGDDPPSRRYWFRLKIPQGVKVVITVSGSKFRRPIVGEIPNSIVYGKFPMKDYLENSDFRTFISPDLNYPEYRGVFTPCTIDSESVKSCWKSCSPPIIGYYPSINGRKGYESFISPALKILKDMGYKFEELPITGVKQEESIELKKQMTLFIDQIMATGYYGMSALEAMQFGIPTIVYLSEKTMRTPGCEELRNAPMLNPGYSVEGLVGLLKKILEGEIDLSENSNRIKQYCTDFHGYQRWGKEWGKIYESILFGSVG